MTDDRTPAGTLADLLVRTGAALGRFDVRLMLAGRRVLVNGEAAREAERILYRGDVVWADDERYEV